MFFSTFKFLFFILLLSSGSIFASDTSTTAGTDGSQDTYKIDLSIPLYEQYKATSNYHFNQMPINILRWGFVGTVAGATVGGILDAQSNDPYPLITMTDAVGGIGMGAGILTGIIIGTVHGFTHEKKKTENPRYHDDRCRFGYELQLVSRSPFSNRTATRIGGISQHDGPGISLIFRTLASNPFIPDNVLLGYSQEHWYSHGNQSPHGESEIMLRRIQGSVRYDFFNWKFVVPYWSACLGYSWGTEPKDFPTPDDRTNTQSITSPILQGNVGCELNLFDFCHADFSIGYEIIGPYLFLDHKEYFPYSRNFLINLSLGTYIF